MTRFHIDTDVLIDIQNKRRTAVDTVNALLAESHELSVCTAVVAEYYSGCLPGEHPRVDWFVRSARHVSIDIAIALRAGKLRYEAGRSGRPAPMLDAIIAAAALSEHAVLITRNVRHFQFSELELLVPEDTAGR